MSRNRTRRDGIQAFADYILQLPKAEVGGLLKEYLAESIHNGWDGFGYLELDAFSCLFQDIKTYHEHGKGEQPFADRIDNVNPVP